MIGALSGIQLTEAQGPSSMRAGSGESRDRFLDLYSSPPADSMGFVTSAGLEKEKAAVCPALTCQPLFPFPSLSYLPESTGESSLSKRGVWGDSPVSGSFSFRKGRHERRSL